MGGDGEGAKGQKRTRGFIRGQKLKGGNGWIEQRRRNGVKEQRRKDKVERVVELANRLKK